MQSRNNVQGDPYASDTFAAFREQSVGGFWSDTNDFY